MRLLFVSYSNIDTTGESPSFLGVLKRCIRLIHLLDKDQFEIHLLNFGEIPMDDPLIQSTLKQITISRIQDETKIGYQRFLEELSPDVLVLGEAPLSGSMRRISRLGELLHIPQICIENYHGMKQLNRLQVEFPWLDQWFFIGISSDQKTGRIDKRAVLVSPLIGTPSEPIKDNINPLVTILGYDLNVAKLGLKLVSKLPHPLNVNLIHSKKNKPYILDLIRDIPDINIHLMGLPNEQKLTDILGASSLVVCKSGFQQIVECLWLNTPVVLYSAPGAVPEELMAREFRPFTIYFPKDEDWSELLIKTAFWLRHIPEMPWSGQRKVLNSEQCYTANELQKQAMALINSKIAVN